MLSVKNMSIQYSKELVLEDISFEVKSGEITVVLGPNGVGKSSLLKSISGLINSTGQVYLNSEILTNQLKSSSRTSYLSQDSSCHADLSVFEVVLLGLMDRLSLKVKNEEIRKAYGIIQEMNLGDIADKNINELSGGQRQMVFIAQTLVSEPKVLLLDEPVSSLDLYRQYKLLNYIQDITYERKIITIMVLHQLDLAAQFANRIIVLKDTKIYCEGDPSDTITEQMLEDVYKIRGKIVREEAGWPHVVTLGAID